MIVDSKRTVSLIQLLVRCAFLRKILFISDNIYIEVTGLVSTHLLMFGMLATLSTKLTSLGNLLRTLLSRRSLMHMKVWRSAQVELFPTKYWPPRLVSFFSSWPRAVGIVTSPLHVSSYQLHPWRSTF